MVRVRVGSSAKHFRDDKDEKSSTETATEEQVEKRPPGGGEDWNCCHCDHNWLSLSTNCLSESDANAVFKGLREE